MASLEQYSAFVETIDRGSMTAAARHLGCSLQSVSRALAALEDELGVELVRRTTRRLQASPAGLIFHQRIKTVLGDIELARAEASRESARIGGLFRVGAPVLFAPGYVTPTAVALIQRFPGLEIELVLSDQIADLIEDHIDVAVRIGELPASGLRARLLTRLRRVVVASPAYLARHGRPADPYQLTGHECVVRTFGPEGDAWPLTIDGSMVRIPVRGALRCNEAASANNAVLLGGGIGLAPLWQVRSDIDQGRLELLLCDYEPPPVSVHAVWPGHMGTPARTRVFIDTLVARLSGERI